MSSSTNFDRSMDAASPSDDQEQGLHQTVWSDPPKRPAGRTKLKETRHPVYRGLAGGWVCELRVHGTKGSRLWHSTFAAAETAARALALSGCGACLNFADSACWMLPVLAAGLFGFGSAHVIKDAVAIAVVAGQRKQPLVSPTKVAD
ncbi:dehydration-responsive element-binding protein 1B-like [Triticum aestivum]|uniref:dehydration-responsive element-binding protein 1B-like n=1 Tax=Triticum aestivum TaxID=4565 RepID=UPI000844C887|nr:dehydration-responsive element-binding protein 1B-like [Triticum aestivum]